MTPGETVTCWPTLIAVAVCRAYGLRAPDVLLLQTDFKHRRLEHHRLPFNVALQFAKK